MSDRYGRREGGSLWRLPLAVLVDWIRELRAEYRERIARDITITGSAFTEISPRGVRRVPPRDVIPVVIAPLSHRDGIALMIWIGYWLGAIGATIVWMAR